MVDYMHQHTELISAAIELADKTGANLYLASYEELSFEYKLLQSGNVYKIGDIDLQVIHTLLLIQSVAFLFWPDVRIIYRKYLIH